MASYTELDRMVLVVRPHEEELRIIMAGSLGERLRQTGSCEAIPLRLSPEITLLVLVVAITTGFLKGGEVRWTAYGTYQDAQVGGGCGIFKLIHTREGEHKIEMVALDLNVEGEFPDPDDFVWELPG